jgi:hypothetical protein
MDISAWDLSADPQSDNHKDLIFSTIRSEETLGLFPFLSWSGLNPDTSEKASYLQKDALKDLFNIIRAIQDQLGGGGESSDFYFMGLSPKTLYISYFPYITFESIDERWQGLYIIPAFARGFELQYCT